MAAQNTPKAGQDGNMAEAQPQDSQSTGDKSIEKPLTPELDAAIAAEVAQHEKLAVQQLRAQKKVRIIIASGRDPSERSPVEVGVNGQHYLIERDKEALVPMAVVNALKLAKESVPTVDSQGRVTAFVPAMRYPLTVLGEE